jgi:two-component system sensor histidine kinase SenX3
MARSERRRIQQVTARLAEGDAGTGGADLLDALEAAADAAAGRAERQRDLAKRLAAALDVLAVGVVVCDEHGEEVYRNDPAVLGQAGARDALAEQAITGLLDAARRGERAERALELFSPVRRNLALSAYPIRAGSVPLGGVVVIEDVSERRRIDTVRRDFVANVSHELKTPVGALSLLAETLDGEEDTETISMLAGRVGAEVERLGRIINDLLDLSRIESEERPPSDLVAVHNVVAEAVEPLRAVAAAKGIQLEIDEVPTSLVVNGDAEDLVSAVSNLVDNAVKYSPTGSPVAVRVTADPSTVSIEVVDRGIGIPARDRERIFERFYRVDRARSRLTGGTGLGLSIVRHVAVNHGGEVTVSSEEGAGSTFVLRLPLAAADARDDAHDGQHEGVDARG